MDPTNFSDRLIAAIDTKKSFIVLGLDPQLDKIPAQISEKKMAKSGPTLQAAAESITEFNYQIIDAAFQYVVAVKPQLAFYERFGFWGIKALQETIDYAKAKNLLVIADAKRGDIGSTAEAYSDAYLGQTQLSSSEHHPTFNVDALTINPYLGVDSIEPFRNDSIRYGKGVFILVRTSNRSAGDVQDLETSEGRVYENVGKLVQVWGEGTEGKNGYRSVGAVVGATYPQEAERLRTIISKSFFLVPGYGAQGASASDVVSCFNTDGYGAIINSSRALIFAYLNSPWRDQYSEMDFGKATTAATIQMRNEINNALKGKVDLAWLKG